MTSLALDLRSHMEAFLREFGREKLCGTSLEMLSGLPVVRFMRTDRETRSSRVATDLDVSRAFGRITDFKTSNLVTWCFLKTIASMQSVVSDRLNVAIARALLGKNCDLLDNSKAAHRAQNLDRDLLVSGAVQ